MGTLNDVRQKVLEGAKEVHEQQVQDNARQGKMLNFVGQAAQAQQDQMDKRIKELTDPTPDMMPDDYLLQHGNTMGHVPGEGSSQSAVFMTSGKSMEEHQSDWVKEQQAYNATAFGKFERVCLETVREAHDNQFDAVKAAWVINNARREVLDAQGKYLDARAVQMGADISKIPGTPDKWAENWSEVRRAADLQEVAKLISERGLSFEDVQQAVSDYQEQHAQPHAQLRFDEPQNAISKDSPWGPKSADTQTSNENAEKINATLRTGERVMGGSGNNMVMEY